MDYMFSPVVTAVPVLSHPAFPVRRIFCVGQNYAAHAREMGNDPARSKPVFFTKPADAYLPHGSVMPYPLGTANLHHEVELVVALGKGGVNIAVEDAVACIFGYATGLDMTRRDLQSKARTAGMPWDMAKAFDNAAPLSAITPVSVRGPMTGGKIELKVNGETRQSSDLANMIWSVPEIIHELSKLVELAPGDLIFTGTPEGVGPVADGDRLDAEIAGLEPLTITIG